MPALRRALLDLLRTVEIDDERPLADDREHDLVLSPIVWVHYLVLRVPVAIGCPRFGLAWVLPTALCAFPITPVHASWSAVATALSLVAATLLVSGPIQLARRDGKLVTSTAPEPDALAWAGVR